MAITRCTVKLRRLSGVEKDASVNVWHIMSNDGTTQENVDGWTSDIKTFYDGVSPYLSPVISRAANAHSVEFADVTPGADGPADDSVEPVAFTNFWTLSGASQGPGLPSECAAVVSFRGTGALSTPEQGPNGTRPRARRRGRIYVGPINTVGLAAASGSQTPILGPDFTAALGNSMQASIDGINAGASAAYLVIYSPADGGFYVIDHVHVDNAVDIMRSRGEMATLRFDQPIVQEPFPPGG